MLLSYVRGFNLLLQLRAGLSAPVSVDAGLYELWAVANLCNLRRGNFTLSSVQARQLVYH